MVLHTVAPSAALAPPRSMNHTINCFVVLAATADPTGTDCNYCIDRLNLSSSNLVRKLSRSEVCVVLDIPGQYNL